MCLSTVYLFDGEEEVKLAENIGGVKVEGDQVILTDLLGIRTAVKGQVETIDLMDNYIVLKRPALSDAGLFLSWRQTWFARLKPARVASLTKPALKESPML